MLLKKSVYDKLVTSGSVSSQAARMQGSLRQSAEQADRIDIANAAGFSGSANGLPAQSGRKENR